MRPVTPHSTVTAANAGSLNPQNIMSQTVQFKNDGFKNPNLVARALTRLGWQEVPNLHNQTTRSFHRPTDPSAYRTRVWFTHVIGKPVNLSFDGDYRRDLEAVLGSDFERLQQQYRLEMLQDFTQQLSGSFQQSVLEDGTVDVEIEIA